MKEVPESDRARLTVPVDDPRAALEFCQHLQEAIRRGVNSDPARGVPQPNDQHPNPQLSIVIPVFNEQENVEELFRRLKLLLSAQSIDFELIFVNDGSTDRSQEILSQLAAQHREIAVIELARNFGQQLAYSAGLRLARGEAVIAMDADLQDPPEALLALWERWKAGYDVAYAVRIRRKEGALKRFSYLLFYRLLQTIASIEIPVDSGDFCIMSRRVVNLINQMPERSRFIRGIRSWVGFRQIGVPIERAERFDGKPKYTLRKLIHLALDGLVSFSYVPLRFISIAGMVVSLLSILLALFYAIKKLFFGLHPEGFATIVVLICFFSGVQLVTIGLMGEYVGRIFEEVKQRPLYIIKRIEGSRFK